MIACSTWSIGAWHSTLRCHDFIWLTHDRCTDLMVRLLDRVVKLSTTLAFAFCDYSTSSVCVGNKISSILHRQSVIVYRFLHLYEGPHRGLLQSDVSPPNRLNFCFSLSSHPFSCSVFFAVKRVYSRGIAPDTCSSSNDLSAT